MIDLIDFCRNSSVDQWFSVFFIIHLANLRSVKIVLKSGKSQEVFQFLLSGNSVALAQSYTTFLLSISRIPLF